MIEAKMIPGMGDTSAVFAIRQAVFVEEQGFSAVLEFDSIDATALHLLVLEDGSPAATARLYQDDGHWHIGRVAVLKGFRGRGIGAVAMRIIMQKAQQLGAVEVYVGAQRQAEGFYNNLGFVPCGAEYDEEGVPHVPMAAKTENSCCCH
jgi:predicted GNAT family N-acyltransferase